MRRRKANSGMDQARTEVRKFWEGTSEPQSILKFTVALLVRAVRWGPSYEYARGPSLHPRLPLLQTRAAPGWECVTRRCEWSDDVTAAPWPVHGNTSPMHRSCSCGWWRRKRPGQGYDTAGLGRALHSQARMTKRSRPAGGNLDDGTARSGGREQDTHPTAAMM